MCRSDGSSSPAPSSNRPGSASAMPTTPGRSATNGRASGAVSFARIRSARCSPCGAPRAMFASRHTLSAKGSSWECMARTSTDGSYGPTTRTAQHDNARRRSASRPRSTGCGPDGRSRDPADSQPPPRTALLRHRQRRLGQSPDEPHTGADTPHPPESARVQCPPADACHERQAGTCFPSTHPRPQSGHRQSRRHVRLPGGQPGNRRPSARPHRCGRVCSRARFVPAPTAPILLVRRAVGIDVS